MSNKKDETRHITEFGDIYLASALVCIGHQLQAVHDGATARFIFEFEISPELEQHVSDYWSGTMRLEPRQFANAIRDLKARTKMRAVSF